MEFHHIVPHDGDMDGETEGNEDGKSLDPPIWAELVFVLINLICSFIPLILVHPFTSPFAVMQVLFIWCHADNALLHKST